MTDKPGEVNKGAERRPSSPANHSWLTDQSREGNKRKAPEEAKGAGESEKRKIIKLKHHDEESEENKRKDKIWSGINADITEIGNIMHEDSSAVDRVDRKKALDLAFSSHEHLPLSEASVDQLVNLRRRSKQLRDDFRKQYPVLASQARERTEDSARHPSYETPSDGESEENKRKDKIWSGIHADTTEIGNIISQDPSAVKNTDLEIAKNLLYDSGKHLPLSKTRVDRLANLRRRSEQLRDYFRKQYPVLASQARERTEDSVLHPSYETPSREESRSPGPREVIAIKVEEEEILGFNMGLSSRKREGSALPEEHESKRSKLDNEREEHIRQLDAAREGRLRALEERDKPPSIHSSDLVSDYSDDMSMYEVPIEINPIDSSKDEGGPGPTTQAYRQEARRREAKKQEEEMKEKEILNTRFKLELKRISDYTNKFSLYRQRDESVWNKAIKDIDMSEQDYKKIMQNIEEIKKTAKTEYFEINKEALEASIEELIDNNRILQSLDRLCADRYPSVEKTKKEGKKREEHIGRLEHMYKERLEAQTDRRRESPGPHSLGSDRSPDEVNLILRELETAKRYIKNFKDYVDNNAGVLMDAVKGVGMGIRDYGKAINDIRRIIAFDPQQISPDDIETLYANNDKFKQIEEEYQRRISSDRPDRSSGGDNALQHEIDRISRHISNFRDYDQDNGEVLDAALKAVGMDRETLNKTIDNITDPNSKQISEGDVDILLATNMQFDEIEEKYQKEISNDFSSKHLDGSEISKDEYDLFLRELETADEHIINFRDYDQDNGEVLDAALEAVGMGRETFNKTIDRITNIIESDPQQISAEDSDTLLEANTRLKQIKEEYQRRISSDRDNQLQREIGRINRYIGNFTDYIQNNGEVLDMAMKAVGMDRNKLNETIGNIKNIVDHNSQQSLKETIDILHNINDKFKQIEDEYQRRISSDGPDRSSGGDSSLQREIDRISRHISNFRDYDQDNGEVLDAALEAVGMDRETLNKTIDNITDPNSKQISEGDVDILLATNMQFDEIEEKYQKEISSDFGSEHSGESKISLDKDDLFLRELETAKRHIDNFEDYDQNNREILDMALETENMDSKKLNKKLDSIKIIINHNSQQISREDINELRTINMRLDEIEKVVKFMLGQ